MQNHESQSDQQKGFHWFWFATGLWIRVRIFNDVKSHLSDDYGQVLETGPNHSLCALVKHLILVQLTDGSIGQLVGVTKSL